MYFKILKLKGGFFTAKLYLQSVGSRVPLNMDCLGTNTGDYANNFFNLTGELFKSIEETNGASILLDASNHSNVDFIKDFLGGLANVANSKVPSSKMLMDDGYTQTVLVLEKYKEEYDKEYSLTSYIGINNRHNYRREDMDIDSLYLFMNKSIIRFEDAMDLSSLSYDVKVEMKEIKEYNFKKLIYWVVKAFREYSSDEGRDYYKSNWADTSYSQDFTFPEEEIRALEKYLENNKD
jgi:hypothetical protein